MSDLGSFVDHLAGNRVARQDSLYALLTAIATFISKYVVLTKHQAIIVTFWVAHTHAIAAADCTPYLQVTSATKRAGKTRLLEVLEPLVARPWLTGRTSAAVLVRKTDAEQPTLLLDESDAAFAGEKEYAEALRGIFNTGYRTSGKASLCVGQGANLTYRDFHTFGAKAIAGIGALPGTIADRAIPIALRRKKSDESCSRWRERDGHTEAAPLRQRLVAWATKDVLAQLRRARPTLPRAINDDRKTDVLEPLFAIAELAGGEWPAQAEKAAIDLCGSGDDTDRRVMLLSDLKPIIASAKEHDPTKDVIPTKDIIAELTALEDRPWGTWRKDEKPITAHALTRLLEPLDIHPVSTGEHRGYRKHAFEDAWTRYLPPAPDPVDAVTSLEPGIKASECQNANNDGPESPFLDRQALLGADTLKAAHQGRFYWAADALTLENPDTGPVEPDDDNDDNDDGRDY
jgi:Protein of unknown function (DUF3631)